MRLARKPFLLQVIKPELCYYGVLAATRFTITLVSAPLGVAFLLIGSIVKFGS